MTRHTCTAVSMLKSCGLLWAAGPVNLVLTWRPSCAGRAGPGRGPGVCGRRCRWRPARQGELAGFLIRLGEVGHWQQASVAETHAKVDVMSGIGMPTRLFALPDIVGAETVVRGRGG